MFEFLNIEVDNTIWELAWPKNDTETLKVIMDDWAMFGPKLITRLKNVRTVIQAGGHCGLYAKLYSKTFSRVLTFEPEHNNFAHLVHNCNDTRIIKMNCALGSENKFVSMGIVSYINTGMHKVLPDGINGLVAYCVTLDSIKPKDVDLIHLDVEGYEYEALKGSIKTIEKYKPLIIVEMSEKVDKIYKLMEKLKYKEVEIMNGMSKNSIFEYQE